MISIALYVLLLALAIGPADGQSITHPISAPGAPLPQWTKYRGNNMDTGSTSVTSKIGSNPAVGWSFQTNSAVASSPALGPDGSLYFGADDRNFYALNASNGYLKWSVAMAAAVSSSPAVSADGKRVYVGSDAADLTLLQSAQTDVCCTAQEGQMCMLTCPLPGQVIAQINVASYGLPTGTCTSRMTTTSTPNYLVYRSTIAINPACDAFDTEHIVSDPCLTQRTCSLLASNTVFTDACAGADKVLSIYASCVVEDTNTLPMTGLSGPTPSSTLGSRKPFTGRRIRYVPLLPSNYFFRFQVFPLQDSRTTLRNIFQFDAYNDDAQKLPSVHFCDGQGPTTRALCIVYQTGIVRRGVPDPPVRLMTRPLRANLWTTVTIQVDLEDLQAMVVTLTGATRGTYSAAYPAGRSVSGLNFLGVSLFFSSPFYPAANCRVANYAIANNFDTLLAAYNTGSGVLPRNRLAWNFFTRGYLLSSPSLMADGTIVVGSMSNRVYAVTPAGAQRWVYRTVGAVQSSPAIASDDSVFVGDDAGRVYSLSSTGGLLWSFTTGNWIYGAPAIYPADGSVIVGSADNFLYRFSKTGVNQVGQVLWRLQTTGAIMGSPAIQPGTGNVVVGNDQGMLYLVGIDGFQRWQYSISTANPLMPIAFLSSPIIGGDGAIYLGAEDGNMYAFTLSGSLLWKVPTNGPIVGEAALGADGNLYFGSSDASMYQVTKAPTTGQLTYVNFTGRPYSYTVPKDTYALNIAVYGAQGADPGGDATKPGMGGMVSATLEVAPGMVLMIDVGGQPRADASAAGGYNGGGVGRCNGGGGGGMTNIYVLNASVPLGYTQILVAGGGGGCGYYGCLGNGMGGAGGLVIGLSGSINSYAGAPSGCQGLGGSQTAGGAGGVSAGYVSGSPGTFGAGGGSSTSLMCSAGGGGGYFGGGGSAGGCGAGGGSSYINPNFKLSNAKNAHGVQMGHGFATIQVAGSPTARPTMMPSPQPSALPTNMPMPNPTLQPSFEPSPVPTSLPTFAPSVNGLCSRYSSNFTWSSLARDINPSNPTCGINICGGTPVLLTTCPGKGGAQCVADTFLRLFDPQGNEVAMNDNARAACPGNPLCAEISWKPPDSTPCQVYTLRMGCGTYPCQTNGVSRTCFQQMANGNNGGVSCSQYCSGTTAGPWNNELPRSWLGAICASEAQKRLGMNIPCSQATPGSPLNCLCQENPSTPWGTTAPRGCAGQVYAAGADLIVPLIVNYSPAPTVPPTRAPSFVAGAPTPVPSAVPTVAPTPMPTFGATLARGRCPLYLDSFTNSDSRTVSDSCGITANAGSTFTVSMCNATFPNSGARCSGGTVLRLFGSTTLGQLPVTYGTNWQCGTCAEFTYTVPPGTPSQQYYVIEGCVGLLECSGVAVVRGSDFTVQAFQPTALPTQGPTFPRGSPTAVPTRRPSSPRPTMSPTNNLFCPAYRTLGTMTDVFNARSCGVQMCSGESMTASMCGNVFPGAYCRGNTTLRLMDQSGVTLVTDDTSAALRAVCKNMWGERCAQLSYTAPITAGCQVYQIVEGCLQQGSCAGMISVGMTVMRPLVTPVPSSPPSQNPSYIASVPTPGPTAMPSPEPTMGPTMVPTRTSQCQLYQQTRNTFNDLVNTATCGVTACAGVPFTISMCSARYTGANCTGNTFLRLFDSSNTLQLAKNDNALSCGYCSELRYTPRANSGCQLYLLREGCSGNVPCSGTAVISGAGFMQVTFPPSLQPTSAPTYRLNRPTPMPTLAPTYTRVCNTYNSDTNVMACGVNVCAGAPITISFCAANFRGAYCTGNVNMNLLDRAGRVVATNDNGPGRCGLCSQLTYTPPAGSGCQRYIIQELCIASGGCTGQAIVTGPNFQIMPFAPTFFPSAAPSYSPGEPTPGPTPSPPTLFPSVGTPSFAPVIQPTFDPTWFPSPLPTLAPSAWPTSVPTLQPTAFKLCPAYQASKTNDATVDYAACGVQVCANQTFLATTCSARAVGAACSGSSVTRLRIFMDPTLTGGVAKEVPRYDSVVQLSTQNGANPCPCGATVQYTPPPGSPCQTYTVSEGCIGVGTCSGTVAIASVGSVIAFNPTPIPTPSPTYMLGFPTPLPTTLPTVEPSAVPSVSPTQTPTNNVLICKLYTAAGTVNDGVTMPVCGVTACANQTFTVSLCGGNFPGASCLGNTFLRLFDQTNSNLLVSDNGGSYNCGNCAQFTYTPPAGATCQTYLIREGCDLDGRCQGTAAIVGGAAIKLVTYAPTARPTRQPTYELDAPTPEPSAQATAPPSMLPTPLPTTPGPTKIAPGVPSELPTPGPTFNALRCPLFGNEGQMPSCQFTICGGNSVNITACPNQAFAGAYCMGDVSFKVFSTQGIVVASNDNGVDPSCGLCPMLRFTAPGTACVPYTLREFCASGSGSCSGVAALLTSPGDGTSLLSGVPSAQPTLMQPKSVSPTQHPTYLPNVPTPAPSVNLFPTAVPTIAPTLQQFCPPFSAVNTNSAQTNTAQCSITACGGQTLVLGCCASDGSQASCRGDVFLRLLSVTSIGGLPGSLEQVALDDDSCGNGGSRITYTVPLGAACGVFVLSQGCFADTVCGGTSNVFGAASVTPTPPTYAPSARPSLLPTTQPLPALDAPTPTPTLPAQGLPTLYPSPAPSATLQSCAAFGASFTNGGEDNYMTCGIYACAGATFTVSNCARTFAGAYCTGDPNLSLTDANELRVTANDDGPIGCGRCSQFTYTATGPCQVYVLRQGCKGDEGCTGQTMVSDANNDVRVQTFSPTLFTTRRPSAVPSMSPTMPPTFGPSLAPTYLKVFIHTHP